MTRLVLSASVSLDFNNTAGDSTPVWMVVDENVPKKSPGYIQRILRKELL